MPDASRKYRTGDPFPKEAGAAELRNWIDRQIDTAVAESGQSIKGIAWIREAFEVIKDRHRQARPGGCKAFSEGDACICTLCLCDKIREFVESQIAQKA